MTGTDEPVDERMQETERIADDADADEESRWPARAQEKGQLQHGIRDDERRGVRRSTRVETERQRRDRGPRDVDRGGRAAVVRSGDDPIEPVHDDGDRRCEAAHGLDQAEEDDSLEAGHEE
jgi:hypothetical protein